LIQEKREYEVGTTTEDFIETSDSNLIGYNLTENEMLDVIKIIWPNYSG